jgi:rhamnose utilization protein RhaD (predicted bifunctional aldolase and dehydrogenase)
MPKVIFLQNHGLIITADDKDEVMQLHEAVVEKIASYLKVDLKRYASCSLLGKLIRSFEGYEKQVVYLSEDQKLNEALCSQADLYSIPPFCPDSLVYCGVKAAFLDHLEDRKGLEEYLAQYYELPKIIIANEQLYIVAISVPKAKSIEEVLKFNILVIEQDKESNELQLLSNEELAYLSNWEAEKFRQNL